jgi:protein-tyrosine phosphatase
MKILMVCLGNICRSPLAEGIMKSKIQQKGLDWEVDSAGTGHWHIGQLPDKRSIAIAKKYNIDITDQRGKQLRSKDLDTFDRIFAMDTANYRDILRLATTDTQREKVDLIMNLLNTGSNQDVPDPYYDDNGFEEVFRMLEAACDAFVEKMASVGVQ